MQARDARACNPVNGGKCPAQDNAAIRLHRDGGDEIIGTCIECGIDTAIAVDAGNVAAELPADQAEVSAHQQLAVSLHGDRIHRAICRHIAEAGVDAAIDTYPAQVIAGMAVDLGEIAADDGLAIGLYGDGVDIPVDDRRVAVGRALGQGMGGDQPGCERAGEAGQRSAQRAEPKARHWTDCRHDRLRLAQGLDDGALMPPR
ncbi:MAG TPA: hypothetical protein PK001_08415, partial [Dokdonella sp.]|uniref:hypothetical protein n=1 Tax=Dokdonella sp. TaxID=2291710 RepID=UPI002BCBC8AA